MGLVQKASGLVVRQWHDLNARAALREFAEVGKGVGIWGRITVIAPHGVHLGDNVHIGANAHIRADGGLWIGDNTHISRNVVIYTANHDHRGSRLPYDEAQVHRPVRIGRNVWIGMNVCIAPGSVIGEGAIVGMGTVVHGEVPPLAIIGAPSWHILGHRDEEHYRRLDGEGSYGGISGRAL